MCEVGLNTWKRQNPLRRTSRTQKTFESWPRELNSMDRAEVTERSKQHLVRNFPVWLIKTKKVLLQLSVLRKFCWQNAAQFGFLIVHGYNRSPRWWRSRASRVPGFMVTPPQKCLSQEFQAHSCTLGSLETCRASSGQNFIVSGSQACRNWAQVVV